MPMHQGRGGSEAQRRVRPLRRREKLLARRVGGAAAILIVVLVAVSLTHSDRRSGHGCIALSLAYATGGTQTYQCGAAARAMCAQASRLGVRGVAGGDVRRACRQAGLRIG
jgi:hypothetical protein